MRCSSTTNPFESLLTAVTAVTILRFLDISLKCTRSLIFLCFTVPANFPASQLYSFLQTESTTWSITRPTDAPHREPEVQATFYRHAFPALQISIEHVECVGKQDIFSGYSNYMASLGLLQKNLPYL